VSFGFESLRGSEVDEEEEVIGAEGEVKWELGWGVAGREKYWSRGSVEGVAGRGMLAGLREGGGGGPDELFRERDGEVERELWVEETGDGEPERDGFKASWGLIDLPSSCSISFLRLIASSRSSIVSGTPGSGLPSSPICWAAVSSAR
jgi:hypothetical protein